jgi:hypothetical protein
VTAWLGIILALGALQGAPVGPTDTYRTEIARYYDAAKNVCRTGVTAEITAAYEQAHRAMEAARATGALEGNFAGLKRPTELWLDCFQSPGDGKF